MDNLPWIAQGSLQTWIREAWDEAFPEGFRSLEEWQYGGVQRSLCQLHVRRSCQVFVASLVHFIVRRNVFSLRSLAVILFLRGFLSNACGYGSACIVFCTVASLDIRCRCRVGLRFGVRPRFTPRRNTAEPIPLLRMEKICKGGFASVHLPNILVRRMQTKISFTIFSFWTSFWTSTHFCSLSSSESLG